MRQPEPPPTGTDRMAQVALFFSFLLPGSGQFVQQRWGSAFVFLFTFSTAFCTFMVMAFRSIIIPFYSIADFSKPPPELHIPKLGLALSALVALISYFWGLVDTTAGNRRIRLAEHETPNIRSHK